MMRLDLIIKEQLFVNASLKEPRFGLCVIGLPGGRKTLTVLDTLFGKLINYWTKLDIPVVIAMPTRTLRDWCARYLVDKYLHQDEVIVFKSKLEFCDAVRRELARLKARIKKTIIQVCRRLKVRPTVFTQDLLEFFTYMYALFKTCRECSNRSNCEFYKNYRLLQAGGFKVFLMTHKLMQVLLYTDYQRTLFSRHIVVIDEADSYLDLFQNWLTPVHLAVLHKLAKWDSVWSRIFKTIETQLVRFEGGYLFFLKPVFPFCLLPICISATIEMYYLQAIAVMSGLNTTFKVVALPAKIIDRCVLASNLIYTVEVPEKTTASTIKPHEAAEKIAEVVINLVDNYKVTIGIAARSYEFNRMVSQFLAQVGMKFYTDLFYTDSVDVKKLREALEKTDVIIWTTGGKLYRGVSLPDRDVIVCTYQAAPLVKPKPHVLTYVPKAIADIDTYYVLKVNNARNVQSYFRANRRRDLRHIFFFADARSWLAMRDSLEIYAMKSRTFRQWYDKELKKAKEVDLQNPRQVVETIASLLK